MMMTEIGKDVTEEKLFPGGLMVMTYYRSAFDPSFRTIFYVLLLDNPYPQFVSGSQEETRFKLAVAMGLSVEAELFAYRRKSVISSRLDFYWRIL